jgi:ABC-type molybdenum transport system ATPase subunit/photorepair protein PhrA
MGLADRQHSKVRTYSMGMKQRLGIGRALLGHPQLLILDEPTNGMDPEGTRQILLNVSQGVTYQWTPEIWSMLGLTLGTSVVTFAAGLILFVRQDLN